MPRGKWDRSTRDLKVERLAYMERAITRFWSKVDRRGADECWPWTGTIAKGSRVNIKYGQFGLNKTAGGCKTYRAHRFAWLLANGAVPQDMNVLHRCDNPRCCNPGHLFIGTQRDNIEDQLEKGRWLYCEKAGRAKLTNQIVLAMRASDLPDRHFADLYNVHPGTIRKARNGQKWARLNEQLDRRDK